MDEQSKVTIESQLRSMFDQVANEPVPDRFVELLRELERSEDGSSRSSDLEGS